MDIKLLKRLGLIIILLPLLHVKQLNSVDWNYYKNQIADHWKKYKKYYLVTGVVVGGVLLYQNRELIGNQYQEFFAKKENQPQPNAENSSAGNTSENKITSGSDTRDAKGTFFYGGQFVEKDAEPFLLSQIPDEDLTRIKVPKDMPPIAAKDKYYPERKNK